MLTSSVVASAPRRDAPWFAALRERASSLASIESGEAYLDHTGSALYAESQVSAPSRRSSRARVLGNPHSQSVASLRSTEIIEDARRLTLDFFAADPATTT